MTVEDSLIASIGASTDVNKLEQCWDLLHSEDIPCRYTEEELDRLLEAAEREGFASQEAVDEMFARWRS